MARSVQVHQIRAAIYICALGSLERWPQRGRVGDCLALHAESGGNLCVVDIRVTQVADHVATGLELKPAFAVHPGPFYVIAVVVPDNASPRCVVAGHTPQPLRAAEQESAIAHHGHHRPVRLCQLDPD